MMLFNLFRKTVAVLVVVAMASGVAWGASYPTTIWTVPTRNTGDIIQPAFFNDPNNEIIAIETGLLNGVAHTVKPLTTNTSDLGTVALLWRNEYLAQTLFGTQGTITANTPFLNLTSTWNAGAVTFQSILLNVTDTASAALSTLIDLQKAGVSQFRVDKNGNAWIGALLGVGSTPDSTRAFALFQSTLTTVPSILIQEAAGQTANALIVQSSTAVIQAGISNSGAGFFATNAPFTSTNALSVSPGAAANVGTIIRGLASQTGDLEEMQNSAANNIFQFTALAAMVDGIQFNPSATGAPGIVSIAAIGTDLNVSLNLVSKGTGTVQANGVAIATAPTLTVKTGTQNGTDYSTAVTTYVDVDATNLSFTVTIPVGQKLTVRASLGLTNSIAATNSAVRILDGTVTRYETFATSGSASAIVPTTLAAAIVGDGASHTVKLQFAAAGGGTATIINRAASTTTTPNAGWPVMDFRMEPAN